ncbi:MAG: GTPase RsgA, partial [Bacteroidales bacterium]|nr:GTPase RsgA [Bacteroidales bacterium]
MPYTVTKHTGSHYLLSELPEWKQFPAVLKGNLRIQAGSTTNPVAVGDKVECIIPEDCSEHNPATIVSIHPRSNYVIRKSANLSRKEHIIAANVDRAFIVVTLDFPEVKLPFLDRILLTCEVYGVKAVIVLNKTDLYDDEYYKERIADFKNIY